MQVPMQAPMPGQMPPTGRVPLSGDTTGLAYLEGYNRFHREIGAARGLAGTEVMSNWSRVIVRSVGRAWDGLIGPVHRRLEALGLAEGAPVVLMPGGLLGMLPLHLAGPQGNAAVDREIDAPDPDGGDWCWGITGA